jgi:hypothetical protein
MITSRCVKNYDCKSMHLVKIVLVQEFSAEFKQNRSFRAYNKTNNAVFIFTQDIHFLYQSLNSLTLAIKMLHV